MPRHRCSQSVTPIQVYGRLRKRGRSHRIDYSQQPNLDAPAQARLQHLENPVFPFRILAARRKDLRQHSLTSREMFFQPSFWSIFQQSQLTQESALVRCRPRRLTSSSQAATSAAADALGWSRSTIRLMLAYSVARLSRMRFASRSSTSPLKSSPISANGSFVSSSSSPSQDLWERRVNWRDWVVSEPKVALRLRSDRLAWGFKQDLLKNIL